MDNLSVIWLRCSTFVQVTRCQDKSPECRVECQSAACVSSCQSYLLFHIHICNNHNMTCCLHLALWVLLFRTVSLSDVVHPLLQKDILTVLICPSVCVYICINPFIYLSDSPSVPQQAIHTPQSGEYFLVI